MQDLKKSGRISVLVKGQPARSLQESVRLLAHPPSFSWEYFGSFDTGQSRPDCFLLGDAGVSSQFLSFSWFPSKANRNVIMKICISHFIYFHIIPVFPPEPTVSRKHINALSKFTIIRKIFPNQKSYL